MLIIGWIVAGALLGWLAGLALRGSGDTATVLDIVAGGVGALLGGALLAPLIDGDDEPGLTALLLSFAGAVLTLSIVRLLRMGLPR